MAIPPNDDDVTPPRHAAVGRLVDGLAWLGSVAVHALVLVALALLTQLTPIDRIPELLSPTLPEPPEEAIEEAFRVSEELTTDVGALADGGVGDAAAAAPLEADVSEVSLELEAITEVSMTAALELPTAVLTSPDPNDIALVRGVGATGATGSRGAVDRLTAEILLSLEQRPTLVVWLFDRSGSLDKQRERVADRFERVYRELGVARDRGAAGFDEEGNSDRDPDDEPLLTTVAAFAEGVEYLTPKPTANVDEIQSAVRAIKPDESGRENVYSAVVDAVNRHRKHRTRRPRRNVMIVVFTDEAGDDPERLDAAVQATRALQTPVYVVGAPAPFGRVDAYVRYVDPDPEFDQSVQWLPVRQGPESLRPERLRLGFFGRGDFDGPTLDSGFGPFGLTRLTIESGGFYIAVHPLRVEAGRARGRNNDSARIDHFFDERLMRRYRPDYVPTGEYQRRLRSSPARTALVEAASLSWTAPLENARTRFPKRDDAQFARLLTQAQRAAALIEPQLRQMVDTLRRGEPARNALDAPRWRAGFDLAMGRALATLIRAEGYNAALAEAKSGMEFSAQRRDTWVLEPSDTVSSGSRAAADAETALGYLKGVVDEHPGTPWALLASRELERPMGWKWAEAFDNLAEREERNRQNRQRRRRERPEPKPRRPPPKL